MFKRLGATLIVLLLACGYSWAQTNVIINYAGAAASFSPVQVSVANPLPVTCISGCSGGGGGASNITQWATTALGVPTAYGTAPTTGNYIGVNAFVTNANTNGQKIMANSSPVVIASDQSTLNVLVTNGLATATGISILLPANSTPVVVKASAGTLWYGHITGIAAAPVYVKFYDNASACSGTLRYQLTLPVASTAANAAGDIPAFPTGITFTTGITYCATTDITASNSGAPTVSTASLNYGYN